MKVLVVGGAGYIGSHMALMLCQQGADVIVLDDLSSGHADAVLSARLVQGSIEDTGLLDRCLLMRNSMGSCTSHRLFKSANRFSIRPSTIVIT